MPKAAVKFALYKEVISAAGQLGGYVCRSGQLAWEPYSVAVKLDNVFGYNIVPAAYSSAAANFYSAKTGAARYGILFHLGAEQRFVYRFHRYGDRIFIAGYTAYFKSAVKDKGKLCDVFVKRDISRLKELFALKLQGNFHFGHIGTLASL